MITSAGPITILALRGIAETSLARTWPIGQQPTALARGVWQKGVKWSRLTSLTVVTRLAAARGSANRL